LVLSGEFTIPFSSDGFLPFCEKVFLISAFSTFSHAFGYLIFFSELPGKFKYIAIILRPW